MIIGPNKDIAQIMAWVMDTYSMNQGGNATAEIRHGVGTGRGTPLPAAVIRCVQEWLALVP